MATKSFRRYSSYSIPTHITRTYYSTQSIVLPFKIGRVAFHIIYNNRLVVNQCGTTVVAGQVTRAFFRIGYESGGEGAVCIAHCLPKLPPPFYPVSSLTLDFGQWPHYFRSGVHQFRVIVNRRRLPLYSCSVPDPLSHCLQKPVAPRSVCTHCTYIYIVCIRESTTIIQMILSHTFARTSPIQPRVYILNFQYIYTRSQYIGDPFCTQRGKRTGKVDKLLHGEEMKRRKEYTSSTRTCRLCVPLTLYNFLLLLLLLFDPYR